MAEAVLTVDLDTIASNYQALKTLGKSVECAAVVKADAYGCGLELVTKRLVKEGCRTFFVAQLDEGITLRSYVPDAVIFILNGLTPCYLTYKNKSLTPVLNSLDEIKAWAGFCAEHGSFPCALQFDTGMSRLGLPPEETEQLFQSMDRLDNLDIRLVLSHLACSEEPDNPMNHEQLSNFKSIADYFPGIPASLAATGGILLGPDYHFDMLRAGIGLYGGLPFKDGRPVIKLEARLIQTRRLKAGETVGYGGAWVAKRETRIATVAVGYADGYIRTAGDRATARIAGHVAPLVGRVSMDLLTFDVTDIPPDKAHPGAMVELIGLENTIDDLARAAGTIGYEILTVFSSRYERRYLGAPQ